MIKTQLFLMRNRWVKKWKLNKKFFAIAFDFTSLFYLFLLFGYIFVAFILDGNITSKFDAALLQVEAFTLSRFWQIVLVIPFFYLLRAFQQPGVLFSTAEYLLTILPHRQGQVWFVTALTRWLKACLIFLVGGMILFLFSPTSILLIIVYVCLLLFMNILLTVPEWKFFQMGIWKKLFVMFIFLSINILSFFVQAKPIGITVLLLFIIYNIISIRKLFTNIDWKKVTAASDYKLWNMMITPILSQTSKIKFKKERQYSMWQKIAFWQKPFRYEKKAAYHRLWHLYFEKNIATILQIVGALLLMLFVFLFLKANLFLLAVAITIHIYTSLISSMFQNRLVTDVVEVLPWDLAVFKKTLTKWAFFVSLILIIPYIIYGFLHLSYWLIPQLIVIIFSFWLMMQLKLDRAIQLFDLDRKTNGWLEVVNFLLLILIMFSHTYPLLLLVGCLIVGIVPLIYNNRDTHLP